MMLNDRRQISGKEAVLNRFCLSTEASDGDSR